MKKGNYMEEQRKKIYFLTFNKGVKIFLNESSVFNFNLFFNKILFLSTTAEVYKLFEKRPQKSLIFCLSSFHCGAERKTDCVSAIE